MELKTKKMGDDIAKKIKENQAKCEEIYEMLTKVQTNVQDGRAPNEWRGKSCR